MRLRGTGKALASAQGLSSTPQAQTGVKVYGVADLAIVKYRTEGASKTALHTGGSGSRLGFLAGEDLGNGWRVGARFEAGINLDTGTPSSTSGNANRVFSRQAYVELENRELGALRLGRQQGPIYNFLPDYDPMLLPPMDSWGVLTTLGAPVPGRASGTGKSSGFLINPTTRTENTIGYISPQMGGAQARLSYSLDEGQPTQADLIEASFDYSTGPLKMGVLYVRAGATPGAGAVAATEAVSEFALGLRYQSGPVQPYFSYVRRDATDPTRASGGGVLNGNTETVKLVGAVIPVSERGAVRMTYGQYDSGNADSDATSYGVAYTYQMSRSLMLMVAATHLTQDAAGRVPVFQSPVPAPGKSVTGLATGLTWRF
ncbi:MAG: porin [Caulobacteraceae bacterium]|nr:MAG: porin [Caulobacteraceae bacterium]